VHHPVAVRLVQRVRDLRAESQNLFKRQTAFLEALGEGFAFDAFHDKVVHTVLMPDIVEDADMRVIQAGDGLGFALEALLASGIGGEMSGENLDGYCPLKTRVPSSIHLAHPARSERSNNLIGSKSCTRSHGHNWPDYNPGNALQACSLRSVPGNDA